MGIFQSLRGTVTLELTSGSIEQSLAHLMKQGITLLNVQIKDELTASFQIDRRDFRSVRAIAQRKGNQLSVIHRSGIYWNLKSLLRRPLVLGMAVLLLFSLILPRVVLFVQVEGNDSVPTRKILEAAAESGIRLGAWGREVRSEKMKNALLSAIPELQWAGVNTYGSVAVITVRERSAEESVAKDAEISSIVAARDGVILSCTVTAGNGLCHIGQAVREGETLISAYTDCGLCITANRAEGEIFAMTGRTFRALMPSDGLKRVAVTAENSKISLLIGKKRINFYKGSGIYDASCVKMYSKYVLTLPGGFKLPVILVRETILTCDTTVEAIGDAEKLLQNFATSYLQGQMVAGTIDHRQETIRSINGAWELTGRYICREMIGKRQQEQIGVVP